MIFEALDKIKRNAIFTTILLMALGICVLICPGSYAPTLLLGFGYTLVVVGLVMVLNFLSSNRSVMSYIKFVGALLLGIAGICVLVFRENTILVLGLAFGILLILDGLRTMIHSFTYARRSGRKAWWVLAIFSGLLIGVGIMLTINPWTSKENTVLTAIGLSLLFGAVVSGFRLFWTWPVRKKSNQEENTNAK